MTRTSTKTTDREVIADFGREWTRFDQTKLPQAEELRLFESYFRIFPWDHLPPGAVGLDLGCGSGRWASYVAPRVRHLHCLDPSQALEVAQRRLAHFPNCTFHSAEAANIPLRDGSLDFAFSLGVLHHVTDTLGALRSVASKLKPGAPFLLYLYYAFDNRPGWFRGIWRISDIGRRCIMRAPIWLRFRICDAIAATVYWPLARAAAILEKCGAGVDALPLSLYRNRSFYGMRTDALDRFGTKLEKRYTRTQIANLLTQAGFESVQFSEEAPFWCAVALKA